MNRLIRGLKYLVSIESTEFIEKIDFDHEHFFMTKRIDMNPKSPSLLFKSALYKNSSLIFFTSLVNYFQTLDASHHRFIPYVAYTNVLVVYYLRKLAARRIIEIHECKKKSCIYLSDNYYEILDTPIKDRKISMYEVIFFKKRSLAEEDLPLIREVMRTLQIPERYIEFQCHDGVLHAKIKKEARVKNCDPTLVLKNIKRFIDVNKNNPEKRNFK